MKFIFIFSLLSISSLFTAQKEYFPIDSGKEWIYKYSEEMKTLMGDVEITCHINDIKTRLGGEIYFVMNFSYSDEAFGQPYEVYYRYVEEKGWYSYDVELQKEELVFPALAKVGYKWSTENFEMEVTSLNGRVNTPGMNYPSSVVVKSTAKNDSGAIPTYTYYVEGIGSVAIVTNDRVVNYLKK